MNQEIFLLCERKTAKVTEHPHEQTNLFIQKLLIFCEPISILRVCGVSIMAHGKESCQCRRHEFNPWSRKNPHASEELRPCTTTIKPVLHSLGATAPEPTLCHHNEKPLHCNEEQPLLTTTRENHCKARKTQCSQNQIIFFKNFK